MKKLRGDGAAPTGVILKGEGGEEMVTTFRGFQSKDGVELDDRLSKVLTQTNGESDRAVALLIASYVEESLGDLLKVFLRKTTNIRAMLRGPNAPLGSLFNRVEIAYALGLLTDQQYNDLTIITNVRNRLAHDWEVINFSHEKVIDKVKNLPVVQSLVDLGADTLSDRFRIRGSVILLELQFLTNQLRQSQFTLPILMGHLRLGTPERLSKSDLA